MLLVSSVGKHLAQMLIPPHAATVLGWAGALAATWLNDHWTSWFDSTVVACIERVRLQVQRHRQAFGLCADICRMRWTLLAIFGAVLAAAGIADLSLEIAHGSDIWRRGNGGIAPLVIGGFCIWRGLAERGRDVRNKPLWPTLAWLTVLVAIGVVLYLVAPPLAFLYAVVVGIIGRFSLLASWLERE